MKCPGQDTQYWKPGDIFEVPCPQCGKMVEFFKDESTRRCRNCGTIMANPKIDFGCAAHCKHAAECIGERSITDTPDEAAAQPTTQTHNRRKKGMKVKRQIIEIDEERCNGCGECITACAEGALRIVDGKAKLISEVFCDGLGACLGNCPMDALRITEKESEEFDAAAVEEHVQATTAPENKKAPFTMACGCSSQEIQTFPCAQQFGQPQSEETPSALSHWPVQIRLVPSDAPFLKNADLLVAADCTPLAYANFHRNLLPGKVVMMGCPKFDDAEEYTRKFAEIFSMAGIKSVTVVYMEVPCCSKLPVIVQNALARSKQNIPFEEIVITRKGTIRPQGGP